MVDYVLIDNHENQQFDKITSAKLFAKGFEYGSSGLPAATKEEKIVETYGGKMIFTPGDIVYSSSKFLDYSLPNLYLKKIFFNEKNKITFNYLKNNFSI